MKIKNYRVFETSALWDDFINKVNTGILPKDIPNTKVIDKLTNLIPSGSKVLDISIGDGANSEYFIEKGFDVYGTDISTLAIETIKKQYPDYTWIEHDTLDKLPFPDNYFNLVFARLALHYFEKNDIKRVLIDINRMLKSNGYFYIMVKCSNTGELNTGKKLYTSDEWKEMISNTFNIIEIDQEVKKAYVFEKDTSNLLQIISKK